MIKDNKHINLNVILSYNKPLHFCISEREAGKSAEIKQEDKQEDKHD